MCVCTWTHMDFSRWKSIWITRACADKPPCSSVEQKLEEGKNSSHVFSTVGAWALFYWSRTIADYFHGDAGWELILCPELPGYCGELEQGPTEFHHHTWKPVSVTLQVMGKRPCGPDFRQKWPLCPHRHLTIRHTLRSTRNAAHTAGSFLWAPSKVSHICLI